MAQDGAAVADFDVGVGPLPAGDAVDKILLVGFLLIAPLMFCGDFFVLSSPFVNCPSVAGGDERSL